MFLWSEICKMINMMLLFVNVFKKLSMCLLVYLDKTISIKLSHYLSSYELIFNSKRHQSLTKGCCLVFTLCLISETGHS